MFVLICISLPQSKPYPVDGNAKLLIQVSSGYSRSPKNVFFDPKG